MTKQEAIEKIKGILKLKFDDPKPAAPAKPAVKQKPTPIKTNEDGSPDLISMSIAIADLREQVAVMAEYANLREQFAALSKRITQIEAGFSKMQEGMKASLSLFEQKTPEEIAKARAEKEVKEWHNSQTRAARDKRISKFFP